MTDDTFELYENLCEELRHLVDVRLETLLPEEQQDVRDRLTDEFRFWAG